MKKLMIMAFVVLMVVTLTSAAFAAAPAPRNANGYGYGCANGAYGACYGFMWNEDGSFASKAEFSARLDEAIEDGLISAEDREYYLEMYDYCADRIANGDYGRAMGRGCGRR